MSRYAPWVAPFLEHLRTSCNVAGSCRAVGVGSATVYTLRKEDGDFAAAWDDALEDGYDYLEAEARRRAFDGVEEPVVYQGQLTPVWEVDEQGDRVYDEYDTGEVYPKDHPKAGQPIMGQRARQARNADGSLKFLTVRKYSDGLAQFLLKGYRRRTFGEKLELTGKDGGPVVVDETTRAARVAQLMALAEQRKRFEDLA